MNRRKDKCNPFKLAVSGIVYAIEQELNIMIIMGITIALLILGFIFNISNIELCLVVLSMGALMAFELVNCAIEATVDLVTLKTNDLAKLAKDCSGSATFILIFVSIFVNGIIFIPKIIDLL